MQISSPRLIALIVTAAAIAVAAFANDDAPPGRDHWAWRAPTAAATPSPRDEAWCRNAIDRFVLARLEREGLTPSPEADRRTLIRRVHLDLLGLPPTPPEVEAFVDDPHDGAYERMVDAALASPRYGERWASMWLDLARFADSQGYAQDEPRVIWRYRDWVIDAFNQNLPYDRFTIEQLAGDLLEAPTEDQQIATAFHRNTMTNSEGGTYDDEFRVAAVVDRVNTSMQVWMGTTVGCAQCHDHKYDPISQREYFQLYDFFNHTADEDLPDDAPRIDTPTPAQRAEMDALTARLAPIEARKNRLLDDFPYREIAPCDVPRDVPTGDFLWVDDELPPGVREIGAEERGWPWVTAPDHKVGVGERSIFIMGPYWQKITFRDAPRPLPLHAGDRLVFRVRVHGEQTPRSVGLELLLQDAPARRLFLGPDSPFEEGDGARVGPLPADAAWVEVEVDLSELGIESKALLSGLSFVHRDGGFSWFDAIGIRRRADWTVSQARWEEIEACRTDAATPPEVREILAIDRSDRTAAQQRLVTRHYVEWFYSGATDAFAAVHRDLREVTDRIADLEKAIPTTPVMVELEGDARRETHLMIRGNFLAPGERVEAAIPAVFPPLPVDAPANRLGFARWLVDPKNPLCSRVTVNRFWEQLFGRGLVKTSEDFGTQGDPPSHPELLDWLATEFLAKQWDVKALLRLIITSATYRQSSALTANLAARDPANVLLARGASFRLSAEAVRDHSLACAGLLSDQMYGPSVKPPQPASGLNAAFGGATDWTSSEGADRYRRGLYTFWRRTTPYPTSMIFDATTREICTLHRDRSNTPLQALATLNDPVYVEAAQGLARRLLREGSDDAARIERGFLLCVARPPTPSESASLERLLGAVRADYAGDAEAAVDAATRPLGPLPEGADPIDAAAWTVAASVLLNLDEALTRR